MPDRDHRRYIEACPAVASRAVGVEPVAVLEQAGEGAEVDHRARVAPVRARAVRLEVRVARLERLASKAGRRRRDS